MFQALSNRQRELIDKFTEFEPRYKARELRHSLSLSANKVGAAAALVTLRNLGALDPDTCSRLVQVIKTDPRFSPPDMQRITALESGYKPVGPKLVRDLAETYSEIAQTHITPEDLL